MPARVKRPCAVPACGLLVEAGHYCERHKPKTAAAARLYDECRGSSAERGYDADWQRFRASFLAQAEHSICADCKHEPAKDVHHDIEIRERPDLRLDPSNCRGLCKSCHRRARERRKSNVGH